MDSILTKANETANFIISKLEKKPEIGVVLGSGLGSLMDGMDDVVEINYSDIPHFPLTTVHGHAGKLIGGTVGGKIILAMKGRFHYYEGHEIADVVFPIRVFKQLGIHQLLVTNAAGGINRSFTPGDLMLITDHISLFAPSALRGGNIEAFGTRFPDMCEAYSPKLIEIARQAAEQECIRIKEGIYAFAQGPMFETPAEIRALAVLGADAVGMSTVPEVITAKHAGMQVLGISCITNMAAGILSQPLNHQEVMTTASEVEHKFIQLVKRIMEKWDTGEE